MGRKIARATAPASRHSDERMIALYLDMLAAERGAGKNTLGAYGRDLADFAAYLKSARRCVANATTDDLRGYLGEHLVVKLAAQPYHALLDLRAISHRRQIKQRYFHLHSVREIRLSGSYMRPVTFATIAGLQPGAVSRYAGGLIAAPARTTLRSST